VNKGRHTDIYIILIFCYWYTLQLRTWNCWTWTQSHVVLADSDLKLVALDLAVSGLDTSLYATPNPVYTDTGRRAVSYLPSLSLVPSSETA